MESSSALQRAGFKTLASATADDLKLVRNADIRLFDALPGRVVEHLKQLAHVPNGHPVSQLEHSLQAATRAHNDGRDHHYVVCTLLHDIGDVLCPHSHAAWAAMMLRPFVSPDLCWMLEKHDVFQKFHYYGTLGRDPNDREQYRGHPCFNMTAEFCELYDQCSFDTSYKSLPLEFFEPMIELVFANKLKRVSP